MVALNASVLKTRVGFNYRMSNIVAGVGRGQLKVLDQRIKQKRRIFDYYKEMLKDIKEIEFMPMKEWSNPNCWLTCIIIKGKITPTDVILELEKNNIESRPLWKPMHLQPFFEKYDFIGEKNAQELFEKGLCLPSDTKMNNKQLDEINFTIRKLFL